MRLPLAALAERNFRLLFSSTTISGVGDGISNVALAFAVLQVSDSPVALGLVPRGAAGGERRHRPRRRRLVRPIAASRDPDLRRGADGRRPGGHWRVRPVRPRHGLAADRPPGRLRTRGRLRDPRVDGPDPGDDQPGAAPGRNALLGLSQNGSRILGPALGGALVAVGSPGAAMLVDAGTFAAAAGLLVRLRLPGRAEVIESKPFFHELREGWGEFRRQTWLWTTIVPEAV